MSDAAIPQPAAPGGDRTRLLLTAGFSPEEVGAWATRQRETLSAGGFSEPEIDSYLGGQQGPVPPAFIDRVARGGALGRIISKIGAGAAEGYGSPQAMSPEAEQFWRDAGLFN